jgi:membrane protease YdiL (CAAX protease family)
MFFVVGGVLSPVAEEVLFRGVLYGFFRRWGVAAALIASTLLFVAAHRPGSVLPIPQIVGGVLFALAFERTRNLMTPITIHVLGNLGLFVLALLISEG